METSSSCANFKDGLNLKTLPLKSYKLLLRLPLIKWLSRIFAARLRTENYDVGNITKIRLQCKNVKRRQILYRLISKDFYTKERMFRFKMSRDNECSRCGEIETYRHLFWGCNGARSVWNAFNDYLSSKDLAQSAVNCYEDVFVIIFR